MKFCQDHTLPAEDPSLLVYADNFFLLRQIYQLYFVLTKHAYKISTFQIMGENWAFFSLLNLLTQNSMHFFLRRGLFSFLEERLFRKLCT